MNQLAANAAWGNEDRTVFELIFREWFKNFAGGLAHLNGEAKRLAPERDDISQALR
ncbi:hypothetical protein [Rhizobium ruizarguesonis]|jgi:hypothetical protein|uniref:hypothetical protein n=1 Tax=Rhizobium ruizarguesonis TaxID=2081791 RepID=UPI0013BBD3C0|nr:hypothetical protein [Rhizobium ruizarguesonis]NEI07745.1 hypothetical protein [Rhizobium ruizarguesonis]NEI30493.1 hypothetical protein [Rhizobium ruizarguesonis]